MNRLKVVLIFMLTFITFYHEEYCIAEKYVDISTLKKEATVSWSEQYTDKFGRQVFVDITPIIGKIERVPIIIAEKPLVSEDNIANVFDTASAKKEENEADTVWYYENKVTNEQIQASISKGVKNRLYILTGYKDRKNSTTPIVEVNEEYYYCSNEVDIEKEYLGEGTMSVKECLDAVLPQISAYYPDYNLDFELIWLDVVKNSNPNYRCILRQRIGGIPILMGAGDPVRHIRQTLDFEPPECWRMIETYRWGDFFRPQWELNFSLDNHFSFWAALLKEKEEIIDDVPLCSMDKVINSIEERIKAGYIRNIYALRFGYCCYLYKNDEIVLYPVWNVECTYIYNPKEGEEYLRKANDVPYTNELNYHTMIINAQTGEFMDPLELKDRLLNCPEIITWEDIHS